MAKKRIYSHLKGSHDFIYVDLLPEVKRSRQFNVNVIITLSYALVLAFLLIYMPYSSRTTTYEDYNGLNNDLKHELMLTQEEFDGYEINLETIQFGENIEQIKTQRIDFNSLLDDIELITDSYDGQINSVDYSSVNQQIIITITLQTEEAFQYLNNDFRNVDWVTSGTKDTVRETTDGLNYVSNFYLGVDLDAE